MNEVTGDLVLQDDGWTVGKVEEAMWRARAGGATDDAPVDLDGRTIRVRGVTGLDTRPRPYTMPESPAYVYAYWAGVSSVVLLVLAVVAALFRYALGG